jgi:hypothetical protein
VSTDFAALFHADSPESLEEDSSGMVWQRSLGISAGSDCQPDKVSEETPPASETSSAKPCAADRYDTPP